jgi:hypothetical protein
MQWSVVFLWLANVSFLSQGLAFVGRDMYVWLTDVTPSRVSYIDGGVEVVIGGVEGFADHVL